MLLVSTVSKRQTKSIVISVIATLAMLVLVPFTKRAYSLDASDLYSYPGVGKFVKPEFDLDKDFGVETEYRLGNWNNVVRMVERTNNPSMGQFSSLISFRLSVENCLMSC